MKKAMILSIFINLLLCAIVSSAMAYSEPSAGSFGYQFYEFLDTTVIGGAIGFCIALIMLGFCLYFIFRSNVFGAFPCAIAAAVFINLKDLVISMGVAL